MESSRLAEVLRLQRLKSLLTQTHPNRTMLNSSQTIQPQRRRTFITIALIALVIPVKARADENRHENSKTTIVTIAPKTCVLKVNNPKNFRGSIFHVVKDEAALVAKLNPELPVHSFNVPSGIYFVTVERPETERPLRYAAPMLHEIHGDNPLEITIGEEDLGDEHWAWIPSGYALIGDTLGVGARDEPLQLHDIKGFWLSRTEVTNQQFVDFLNAKKHCDEDWLDLQSKKCFVERIKRDECESVETFMVQEENANKPIVMISHAGATAYCQWLSETTGRKHRLPTEFEWEKAARGPASFVYAYGNIYNQNRANQESGLIAPVGQFLPNGYGLLDMTGNVFEWMDNQYDPDQPDLVMNQSLRGGSFVLDGIYQRCSFRMRQSKTVMTDDIGFRVLREMCSPRNR